MAKKTGPGRWGTVLTWVAAVLVAYGAIKYQRLTGPTYPLRGTHTLGGGVHQYELTRSDVSNRSNEATEVTIPVGKSPVQGVLQYKRYNTDDGFTLRPLLPGKDDAGGRILKGSLPAQPAAGKLEYFLQLTTLSLPPRIERIPAAEKGNVVIRYKDEVPGVYLGLHIALIILTLIFGVRTILAALFAPAVLRRWVWITMLFMTGGVAVFGPIVQKFAFGKYWAGWPYGGDWTDNKSAVMWGAWLLACLVIGFRGRKAMAWRRVVVLLAAVAMFAAFLIPHSYRGSTLDYGLVDKGVPADEAIKEGR